MLVFACLAPHPPLILPDVGSEADRAKVKKTIQALEKLGKQLAKAKPDCLIITSPHPDWGVKVPLHFLMENGKWKMENYQEANYQLSIINYQFAIYPILTTFATPKEHFEYGKSLANQLQNKLRFAWIASGDMSHRLKEDGPYGLHPSGPKFDREFIERLKKKDIQGIINLPERLVEEAGECGLRSFCMLLGALQSLEVNFKPEVLSYEGPFGVGYLVANFKLKNERVRQAR